jgi:hypothetical protein
MQCRLGIQPGDSLANGSLRQSLRFQDAVELCFDARDFGQTDVVDLFGIQRRGGMTADQVIVEAVAVG